MSEQPPASLEIERKYDVDGAARVPDLSSLPGVQTVSEPEPRALDARYLDTPDGRLAAAGTALRRRAGGPDEGWHIKRATPEGKLEWHWPLGADTVTPAEPAVPATVQAALSAIAAPPFVVVARIENARTAYLLRDATGAVVAEFADDRVNATDLRRQVQTSWREWELELGPAAPSDAAGRAALFAAADALVLAAGGTPSASGSKLARALGV